MSGLDTRSVVLLTGLMGLFMSVVIFFLRRNYPPSIKGLTEWASAPAILFVATLLFAARGVIPNLLSVVLANLLLFSGTTLLYFGSQRFFGLKPSVKLWSSLIVVTLLPFSWFALVEPHYGIRLAFITGFMTTLSFIHFRLILLHGPRQFSSYFTGGSLLILALTQALRFVSSFGFSAADVTFDNTTPWQSTQLSIYALAILTQTIGFVLMATDRLRTEFEHVASHDSLTGALTRRALLEACEQELERCRRKERTLSLLMMDLDHFKAINDNHGHLAGDRVLTDFGARVAALLRRPDSFGRFGGEEFVALLPETEPEAARIVAERIRAAMETAGEQPGCTVSIGIAVSRSDDSAIDAVLARADAALYRAKAGGRNRVEGVAAGS